MIFFGRKSVQMLFVARILQTVRVILEFFFSLSFSGKGYSSRILIDNHRSIQWLLLIFLFLAFSLWRPNSNALS